MPPQFKPAKFKGKVADDGYDYKKEAKSPKKLLKAEKDHKEPKNAKMKDKVR